MRRLQVRPIRLCATVVLLVTNALLGAPNLSNAQAIKPDKSDDLPALVVFVRHGDVSLDIRGDPPLIPAGIKRSHDLASALRNAAFTAIVTTQFMRTRDTAKPIADALGLVPEVVAYVPPQREAHTEAMVNAVRKHKGGVVLIVGHTNTLPPIIAALGGPRVPVICDTVFDNLFFLFRSTDKIHFAHARYGAASAIPGPDCH